MAKPEQPLAHSLPTGGRRREEIAQFEVGHTTVRPVTVRVLLGLFLTAIAVTPIVELIGVRARGADGVASAWSHFLDLRGEIGAARGGAATPGAAAGVWRTVVARNRIVLERLNQFERALEDESLVGRSLRPSAQVFVTGWLGAGNERVYVGREGWLFYRPDVEYVTGRRFLEPAQLRRRVDAAREWEAPPQPDPRRAIVRFRDDLASRGITLVVVPTPLKPGVHPEKLARRYAEAPGVLQNPSFSEFIDDLTREGVLIFDPSQALASARYAIPQFLATDTHWRPESMEAVAEELGGFIAGQVGLPSVPDPGYTVERVEVDNLGDVARMLDLPNDQSLFPRESIWLRRILQRDGSPWRPSRDADVLVLGDSFSNVYALESMGWGTSAGFVEQLSYMLGRPVDRLVQNNDGAFATRALLQRDPDRLQGKRVVVYQFAARELAFGDWKEIRLPPPLRRF